LHICKISSLLKLWINKPDLDYMKNVKPIDNFNYLFPELTCKQYKVLEMYASGSPQKQLSIQLDLSIDTVKEHLLLIKKKLGCQNTLEIRYVYLSRLMGVIALRMINL
ncbi:helix-turn-helix transcriptional regulator, partial [Vibrio sp. 10N.222.54.E8]|uniref:helix-turn-helix transcriptional regulator n=2 Tax=Vibrio TaxID=662 RepID=UPI00354ECACD